MTQQFIPTYISAPLLHMLAKRANPNMLLEGNWVWLELKKMGGYECMICHQHVSDHQLHDHGAQHLKEHNLLPFL